MKRILIPLGALMFSPSVSYAQVSPEPAPAEVSAEQASVGQTSTLESSGVSQRTYIGGVYASESSVKLNTIFLDESDASGLYSEQVSNIQSGAILRSNVNVNSIQLYSGQMNDAFINQSTYVNGLDVQDSNLEINRVILN